MTVVAEAPAGRRPAQLMRRFVAGAAVDSLGTGIAAAGAILYFVTVRGFSAASVAVALSAGAVLAIFTPLVSGRLADRHGLTRVYVCLLVLRAALYLVYPLATGFAAFLVLTWAVIGLETTTPPLQQALVGRLFGSDSRVRLMSLVMAARNAALGAGTLLAGLALTIAPGWAVAALLAFNGVTFAVLAVVVFSMRHDVAAAAPPPEQESTAEPRSRPALREPAFLGLTVANGVLLLHDSVLFILLPLWTVTTLGLSPVVASVAMAVNTGLSVVLQLVFGRMRRLTQRPRRGLVVSVAFLVLACVAGIGVERLADAGAGVAALAAGCLAIAVLLTVGENLHTIAAWEVSYTVAPADRGADYLSVFGLGYAIQRVLGPVLMTALVLGLGAAGWLALAAVLVAAAAGFLVLTTVLRGRAV
ncbi:MFS transporter [Virgisporangium aurantiacum]|uniref:MFS transporter n=1 Tax=Virgisporangium aurantiacum TaxID=175570 RepID=A0A8J3Z670_9ACTN|nr:MFS transporter [Virgisporangium aurantiacum]GIJ57142.1 MFS transporter [Virgisporangium aurantiacum]